MRFDTMFNAKFNLFYAMRLKLKGRKPPKPPRPGSFRPAQLTYLKKIRIMLAELFRLTREIVIAELPTLLAVATNLRPDRTDDYADDIAEIIARLRKAFGNFFTDAEYFDMAMNAATGTETINNAYFRKLAVKMVGIDLGRAEPWLKQEMQVFVKNNMTLVKSIAEEHIERVEKTIMLGAQQGWRHEELAKTIEDKFGIAENKAKLIARDQVSKFNAALTESRMKDAGIEKYIWQTSGDERVRESHAEKDGKTFSWDDPPEDTGNPGEDINCRCVAIPVLEEKSET